MMRRAWLAIAAMVVIGLSSAPVFATGGPTPPPPCTSNCGNPSGGTNPTGITGQNSGDMSLPGTPNVAPPNDQPPSANPGTTSCSGPGWDYYGVGYANIPRNVMSGVNITVVNGLQLVGHSPHNSSYNYTQALATYPKLRNSYPQTINAGQTWYAAWVGIWTPTYGTKQGFTQSWQPVAPAQYALTPPPLPALGSNQKWVFVQNINSGRQHFAQYQLYDLVTTTKTVRYVNGCNLTGRSPQYFYPVTPCYTNTCLGVSYPTGPSDTAWAQSLYKGWSAGQVESAPPGNAITVWVPTEFGLAGANLPPATGWTAAAAPVQVPVSLDGSPRLLTLHLYATIAPVSTTLTYTASGAQSGHGFTCTVDYSGYSIGSGGDYLIGGGQQSCTGETINAGYYDANSSPAGYVFTHDALHLTANIAITLAVGLFYSYTVNGTTYTYPVSLSGLGPSVTIHAVPENAVVQQVEGVTVPGGQG